MDYTILQVAADTDSVLDALTTLAPGWSDRTGMEHAQGWTTVPVDRQAAERFAPLLVQLLGRGVLVWTVDSEQFRAALYRTTGDVLESADRRDQVDELTKAFNESHLLVSSEDGKDTTALAAAATDTRRPPQDRHRAFADLLGVPYVAPDQPPGRNPTTPSLTNASLSLGSEEFRRRQRIKTARSWLHLFSGLGAVAIIGMVIRGPWIGIPVALAIILVLQLVRFVLGRSLPSDQR
ncbi:hypothetical protein [Actinopolymorpha alba]|uniref:hypothetical protein n=1 Tax=Actinopolymorpha alba TaxID=533267 RepID=UPI0012F62166|nr:hypothetical protein [Actinopolymorpha alba]